MTTPVIKKLLEAFDKVKAKPEAPKMEKIDTKDPELVAAYVKAGEALVELFDVLDSKAKKGTNCVVFWYPNEDGTFSRWYAQVEDFDKLPPDWRG